MRFLTNENFPFPSIRMLRIAGHDVASVAEDSPGIADSVVLARAGRERRILLTLDSDYEDLVFRERRAWVSFTSASYHNPLVFQASGYWSWSNRASD